MTRLLICRDCRSIEELPDYDGPPEYDVLLDNLVEAHVYPNGEKHFGNMATTPDAEWADPYMREQIVKQIASKTTGMESEFYATKNTYVEDALKCYQRHRRPQEEGCNDYRDSKKRIGNPSKMGWEVGPKVYLCDFCPYHSYYVMTEKRHQAGLYKEN
jgi:hypothetical protein